MATVTATTDLVARGEPTEPRLAVGRGQPDIPWTILQRDRIYNVLLAGGQGSGKSSLLLRLAMGDLLAENTATVVLDMKGSLSERLLRLTPPRIDKRWYDHESGQWRRGTKRLWYLDLGRPAFGLTPLRVEAGWTPAGLADEFARIGDSITRALLDLYPGQIMGSSEDLIERAVVGTMAIAWWEHTQRCAREGVEATARGFTGSFEVLAQMFSPTDRFDAEEALNTGGRRRVRPNRWHQAAGRACQRLPNLDQVAETMLYEIPRQARDNLGDIAKRMEAPANKIRPLVGAATSVRRFVGHPERLSLRSVIEAHDTLIVNPRVELIGEDQAAILTNFVVHMLDLQLKRQLGLGASTRPRVSLIIDEAQRLVTDTLIRMVEAHREAGLTTACALQYVSQLGAYEPSAARREKILKGVGNLLQTKVLFRMSDSEDADRHTQIFRSVYETMVRADPTSRARMPFDPARMQTLRDHHALVSLVSSAGGDQTSGLLDGGHGATRLPAFVTETFRMPDVEEIADGWRDAHLARQGEVFSRYPENMTELAVRDVPAGLGDNAGADSDRDQAKATEAQEVAAQTVGAMPEGAMRKDARHEAQRADPSPSHVPPRRPRDAAPDSDQADDGEAAPYDGELFETAAQKKPGTRHYAPELLARPGQRRRGATGPERTQDAPPAAKDDQPPSWQEVGGVRIERSEQPAPALKVVGDSPVLRHACRPTDRALPHGETSPATEAAQQAMRAAATLESITSLGRWQAAGQQAADQAAQAAKHAREEALAEAKGAGRGEQEAQRLAERRARSAAQTALRPHAGQPWRTPVKDLEFADADTHTLEVIARLRLAAPLLLGQLLEEPLPARAVRKRLAKLHDAGLIAQATVGLEGRRGRPPLLFTIAPRGLEYLRARRQEMAPDQDIPRYLDAERKPPEPGKGREVPHELALQVALVALRQYDARLHWHTTRMPGGRWDVGMVHHDQRDRTLRLADLLPAPGYSAHGEQLSAPAKLEPDLSVQMRGPVDGGRAVIDLLLEVDRTDRGAYNAAKYAAYDHFLGGWCLRTRRFGHERATRPLVVFVARQARAVPALLASADRAMTLGFGAPGRYEPSDFEYPGRAHIAFTCMEWLLAGDGIALRLPDLPPKARGSETQMRPERVALVPEAWWPAPRR
ncbi:MAG: type IV secretion system DNA-binding domain-containing protein [Solirubrobacteraceae bacterium MAG38_C4-C5]|nr:type IV secretion system DNA-binding domain-containing protein [Candidatus Siliceabacter maunaloa]